MLKKVFHWSCLGILAVLVAFLAAELCLRFYNPFPFRLRGSEIILPSNARYEITTHAQDKLDPVVRHTKNSLGFRGPEPDTAPAKALKVLTIGGSTTECFYISDGKTWPELLSKRCVEAFPSRIFLNNAGLDGHSSRGHLALLKRLPRLIKADVALFLVGINDVDLSEHEAYDRAILPEVSGEGWTTLELLQKLSHRSAVLNTALNLRRSWQAQRRGLAHRILDFTNLPQLQSPVANRNPSAPHAALTGYAARLEEIAEACQAQGILPIFITQPTVYGGGLDPDSGIRLDSVLVAQGESGAAAWSRLEAFNNVTRKVSAKRGILCIDLAAQLPKRSAYYYDFIHFSNAGNSAVADLVFAAIQPTLRAILTRRD